MSPLAATTIAPEGEYCESYCESSGEDDWSNVVTISLAPSPPAVDTAAERSTLLAERASTKISLQPGHTAWAIWRPADDSVRNSPPVGSAGATGVARPSWLRCRK